MKKSIYFYVLAGILLLNILSYFLFIRLDLTANKRYSLSPVSKEMIKNTRETVTVDFYLSEDLPFPARRIAKEFLSLLKEYRSLSHSGFNINVIYPNDIQTRTKAEEYGIIAAIIEQKEANFEKIQNVYLGAVFRIGDRTQVIPYIDQTTPLEYEITRILKQNSEARKPRIAFITGHQEAGFAVMPQLINQLSEFADLSNINLSNSPNLDNYEVLCIIAPKEIYSFHEKKLLEQYLSNGGRLFIALNHAVGQISDNRNTGFINHTGIEELLESKGLRIMNDFVIDNHSGTITVDHYNGFRKYKREIPFPYLPIITNFSEHIITQGLSSIFLPFASSMRQVETKSAYTFVPLARTSAISGTQRAPVFFDLRKRWVRDDFSRPHSIVAALLTNEYNNSSIVAVSNADFLINDIGLYSHVLSPDNINFAMNSIEWLTDNSGLIKLRSKFTNYSHLEIVDKNTRLLLQYLNFLLPIFLISILWACIFQIAKNKRTKRMSGGYID